MLLGIFSIFIPRRAEQEADFELVQHSDNKTGKVVATINDKY